MERKAKKAKKSDKIKHTKISRPTARKQISKKFEKGDVPQSNDKHSDKDPMSDSDVEGSDAADMCQDTDDDIDCDTDWGKEGDWYLFQYIFDARVYYVGKVISIIKRCQTKCKCCSVCI